MPKHYFLPLCFVFVFTASQAQKRQVNPFDTAIHVMDKQPENYLTPVATLEKIKPDASDQMGMGNWQQAAMTYESFLGDYRKLLQYSDARYGDGAAKREVKRDTAFVKEHQFVDAATYITARTKLHQVVMINEAHHLPFDRTFVLPMLKSFYAAGYRYLAIETLDDTTINSRQYPDYKTGYYTIEPLFGELIREALRLHFKLIKYESEAKCDGNRKDDQYCSRFRDSTMAVNLNGVFKTDPKAKMLVYAGYDHIHEGTETRWKKMAMFFKEITGIDPFTVETTVQVEHLYPGLNQKEFNAVNDLKHISQPVIALKDNQPWHGNFVDATVIFPKYMVKGKRPSYYSIGGMRSRYDLGKWNLKSGQYIQAFYKDETPGNRTPADQFVIGDEEPCLYLFKGVYDVEVKDSEGGLIRKQEVTINR